MNFTLRKETCFSNLIAFGGAAHAQLKQGVNPAHVSSPNGASGSPPAAC